MQNQDYLQQSSCGEKWDFQDSQHGLPLLQRRIQNGSESLLEVRDYLEHDDISVDDKEAETVQRQALNSPFKGGVFDMLTDEEFNKGGQDYRSLKNERQIHIIDSLLKFEEKK